MPPTKEELEAQKEKEVQAEKDNKEKEALALAEAEKTEKEKEHMIPKSRLDEEITKRKELKGRLDAIEVANKEAEEQRLKDNEEYKTLSEKFQAEAEALKPKADIADAQEATLATYLKAQIEKLPEDVRTMVPENYSTMDKLDWLAQNGERLMKPDAPDIGAFKTGGGNGKVVTLTDEEEQTRRDYGYSREDYIKHMTKE